MKYSSINEIIDMVSSYLDEDIYYYAIMIDGAWGSGKTYLVKEILIPKLQDTNKERNAICISLYGLKSKEEIASAIFTSVIEQRIGKGTKILPMLTASAKALADFVGIGSDATRDVRDSVISPFLDYKKHYFIFDDLERCSMPINEALSYINCFLEQKKAKVLIIANEEEIGSVELPENRLLGYLVASQNTIKWSKYEKMDSLSYGYYNNVHTRNQEDAKPELEEIKWRSNLLSEEVVFYKRIKEKLIAKTILYRPSLTDVVPAIFKKCFINIEDDNLAVSYINTIQKTMESESHYNLRTLQYSLAFFKMICADFPSGDNNKELYQQMSVEVLKAILRVSIAYKIGEKPYHWDEHSEYGVITIGSTLSYYSYFTSFKFIHDFIYHCVYSSEVAQKTLSTYLDKLAADSVDSQIKSLSAYWEMSDEEIEGELKRVLEILRVNSDAGSSYRWILSLLFKLKGIGFEPIPIKDFFDVMKDKVSAGASIDTMRESAIHQSDPCFEEYRASFQELQDIASSRKENTKSDSLNAIFDETVNWGEALANHYRSNKDSFMTEKGFFRYIDVEKCFSAIKQAQVKDLSDFRRIISSVYNFSGIRDYFIDDIENISKLNSMIAQNEFDEKMKQYNYDLLKQTLESVLERLKGSAE